MTGTAVLDVQPMTVLIVDDEPDMRLIMRGFLEARGLLVVDEASDGADALTKFRGLHPPAPTAILLDNRMPSKSGLEVAAEVLAETPGQMIVLFSAYLDNEVIDEARHLGVAACVAKNNIRQLPEILRELAASRN